MSDYISRYEIFSVWRSMPKPASILSLTEAINRTPSADVEPVVHGRWIPIRESEITGWNPEFSGRNPIGGYKCSECGEFAVFDCNDWYVLSDFCPNCGAKYFRIEEIDAATFELMTGQELDCLQLVMLADDGNVYVAADEYNQECLDIDLEMFDTDGGADNETD